MADQVGKPQGLKTLKGLSAAQNVFTLSTLTNLSERLVRQVPLGALGIHWSEGWLCWLMKPFISSAADGLRTAAGR